MNQGCPIRAVPGHGFSDWLRDGHVTQYGPIGTGPRTFVVTLRKESGGPVKGELIPQRSQQRPMTNGIVGDPRSRWQINP